MNTEGSKTRSGRHWYVAASLEIILATFESIKLRIGV